MESVTIQIGATWANIARSPVYWIVAALQGVSVTFAPLVLYWSGRGGYSLGNEWVIVPVCLAVMYLVPLFHFQFSNRVIQELRRPRETA
jgi:hypothetical protein